MNIQKNHIEKFRQLYKQEYGIDLSSQEAAVNCHKLVNLVKIAYRPVSKNQITDLKDYVNKNILVP